VNHHLSKLIFAFFTFLSASAFAQAPASQPLGPRIYGDITITSDYNEKGLTQTDHNPAVIAGFGYWFGQAGRIGVQAGNVKYQDFDSTVRGDLFAEYKFFFSQNADLKVKTSYSYYSPSAGRNNLLTGLDLNLFTYHFLYEHDDNFEGTKTRRDWLAFHKDFALGTSFQFNLTVGYSMVQSSTLQNFYDTRDGVSYLSGNFYAGLFNCYNSKSSQFPHGEGDMAFIVEAGVRF
jgi:uncharacterized protein (TIGR02001 family)